MAVPEIEAVLEFLRSNGFSESESALMEDIVEKSQLGSTSSFDYQKFLFPMVPPPPPLKIPATRRSPELPADDGGAMSSGSSQEEFVSLGSSTTELCSSEFTNPYGVRTAGPSSQGSSDRLSQFGTARDYHDFDMQNDLYWYKERDEDYAMPPSFGNLDSITGPSEDKFVMTVQTGKQSEASTSLSYISDGLRPTGRSNSFDKPWPLTSEGNAVNEIFKEYYDLDQNVQCEEKLLNGDKATYSCSESLCACCGGAGGNYGGVPMEYGHMNIKQKDINSIHKEFGSNNPNKSFYEHDLIGDFKTNPEYERDLVQKDCHPGDDNNNGAIYDEEVERETQEAGVVADEGAGSISDELMISSNDDDHEVFNLRIIHRKNRTGFEENKDFPIVLNSIIAGRYYVTEYLGSAAFSKVVQAHDLQMGVDVCLKIIKNDKDFFDQSLDEIKLLKFVNKHDPGDTRHILRLYDYFYHQEHLFIVCELLRANLYEFQKYNRESGGEPYFTLSRLQVIARQCLEAMAYLHNLGVIHCDLKPENILIKSYRKCEIKVIDLGSSCFRTDNLSLYVQSRSYRAPEVILGLPYDEKIDLWSLGCILAELCSGEVLFPNEALILLLARMIGMFGPIDIDMLLRGQETHKYFTKEYDLYHINEETNQLEYIFPEELSLEHHLQVSDSGFIDFTKMLLEINPERRPTAKEALEHPWLSHSYE